MTAATAATLRLGIGQHSAAGRKPLNQDFYGAAEPPPLLRASKGVAVALADGIGSSAVSHIAAAAAVRSFLGDYYATSEAWTVRRSAQCVIAATNAWLHAQSQRGAGRLDQDHGHVCTFTALVFKGREAHLLHVGDTRAYRLHPHALEQLSQDHRVRTAEGQAYLGRALGVGARVEIDHARWPLEVGELYLLATDGAYEYLDAAAIHTQLTAHAGDLQASAEALVAEALARGSPDNATVQLVRVDGLPDAEAQHLRAQRAGLALPPVLAPRMRFEGYTLVRELHHGTRSHVFLAHDDASGQAVALKLPGVDLRDDPAQLDRFVLEEWVARRVDSPHLAKAAPAGRPRSHLFVATEYVEGQSLAQWMTDHPRPSLDEVRRIVGQVAAGVQALHRKQVLHRDLRPDNVRIDTHGTAKLIDFAAAHVAGLAEGTADDHATALVGELQYTAPEVFTGEGGGPAADLFSLAVITFQMLTSQLPYGLHAARVRTPQDLHRLRLTPLRALRPDLPTWVEAVLRKALHPQAARRQEEVAEFVHDLHEPGPQFQQQRLPPLIERHPVAFWRGLALLFAASTLGLLVLRLGGR